MICPGCKSELEQTPPCLEHDSFTVRHGYRCRFCKWRGWIGISVEEAEDGTYNDTHMQIGINRLWEGRKSDLRLRAGAGARLCRLLNALDRIAGELNDEST